MAFTNSTDNYNLPQYVSTDIPSYLVDQNNAWETIDTNLKEVSDVATAAQTAATSAGSAAAAAQTDATEGKTKANAALNNEADTFSESKTYEVGEYVTYGNVLYICTNAVTVAGPFSGSDWDAVTVGDQLESQSEAITALQKTIHRQRSEYSVPCGISNSGGIGGYRSDSFALHNQSDYPSNILCINVLGAFSDNGQNVAVVGANINISESACYVWLDFLPLENNVLVYFSYNLLIRIS